VDVQQREDSCKENTKEDVVWETKEEEGEKVNSKNPFCTGGGDPQLIWNLEKDRVTSLLTKTTFFCFEGRNSGDFWRQGELIVFFFLFFFGIHNCEGRSRRRMGQSAEMIVGSKEKKKRKERKERERRRARGHHAPLRGSSQETEKKRIRRLV